MEMDASIRISILTWISRKNWTHHCIERLSKSGILISNSEVADTTGIKLRTKWRTQANRKHDTFHSNKKKAELKQMVGRYPVKLK